MATTVITNPIIGGVEPYVYSNGGTAFLLSKLVTFMQNNNYHVAVFSVKPVSSSSTITYGMDMPSYVRTLHFLETMLSTNVGDSHGSHDGNTYPTYKPSDTQQITVKNTFMVELF